LSTPEPDALAWEKYPQFHQWFNKLYLSERLGYKCGPCGLAPAESGWYCVRPVINLAGMGVGARKQWINAGDNRSVEPGYFWCEWFDGRQISATYRWRSGWIPVSAFEGVRDVENLSRFSYWMRTEAPILRGFEELHSAEVLNVEFIGDRIVEINFRESPDPDADLFIPIWADMDVPEDMIPSFEDADGYLEVPRLGFVVR